MASGNSTKYRKRLPTRMMRLAPTAALKAAHLRYLAGHLPDARGRDRSLVEMAQRRRDWEQAIEAELDEQRRTEVAAAVLATRRH